jgi:hypothetical protein
MAKTMPAQRYSLLSDPWALLLHLIEWVHKLFMKASAKLAFTVIGFAVVVVLLVGVFLSRQSGFSARQEPSALEALVARKLRHRSVPEKTKEAKNPFTATPEILKDARAHFADHCALCHANDGSGQTTLGQNLYPKAPDMRQPATQSLSDGELFYIIHNGIRLSGMPAWGPPDADADEDSWKLVLLIRHLPNLTKAELEEMEKLNPRSIRELQEEKEEEEFLRGEDTPAPESKTNQHKH